jgi:hypothetical protein
MRTGLKEAAWPLAGGAVLLVALLLALHFYRGQETTAALLESKAQRVDLVTGMRVDLARAVEAEKSAVLDVTDQGSRTFADQARAATAAVDEKRRQLGALLAAAATPAENDLLARFDKGFVEFQRIDRELLALAVKNTNLKAYSLAFGPAAQAVDEMDGALSRVIGKGAASRDSRRLESLACEARTSILRIQALLAPHIAEESDQRMDQLEAAMARQDERAMTALAALQPLATGVDLEAAIAAYKRFSDLRRQILSLSRENTNVRSLGISLDQKRKVTLECQDALAALQSAIEQEPITAALKNAPSRPR